MKATPANQHQYHTTHLSIQHTTHARIHSRMDSIMSRLFYSWPPLLMPFAIATATSLAHPFSIYTRITRPKDLDANA